MPHVLAETPALGIAGVLVGDDGDPDDAATLTPSLQELANRTRYLHNALSLVLRAGGPALRCDASGGTAVTVGAVGGVALAGQPLSTAGDAVLGPANIDVGGALAASTWYYVYGFNNGGILSFEISATGPDAARVVKSTDGTRVYLGCFPTDAAAHVLPFTMRRGRFRYRELFAQLFTPPNAVALTDYSLAAAAAPTARRVEVRAAYTPSAPGNLNLSTLAADGAGGRTVASTLVNGAAHYAETCLACSTTQTIAYQMTNAGDALALWVLGFEE